MIQSPPKRVILPALIKCAIWTLNRHRNGAHFCTFPITNGCIICHKHYCGVHTFRHGCTSTPYGDNLASTWLYGHSRGIVRRVPRAAAEVIPTHNKRSASAP